MAGLDPPFRARLRNVADRAGFYLSLFIVFACGWFAMSSTDWTRIVLLSLLAIAAGLTASAFAKRARKRP
jgi:ABC-type antimicrobial peptide transport system permease subunit